MTARFHRLKYVLAAILIFIGSEIFIADELGLEKFQPALAVGITCGLLVAGAKPS